MNYIQTNNKWARQRGTTLIELSVVIAVILLLVGVLFIGVQAWRDGANRAACLVNLSSIQKAVRGYSNMNNLNVGDTLASTALTTVTNGAAMFTTLPQCPVGPTASNYGGTVPPTGTAYATCATTTNGGPHVPTTTNW